MADPSFFAPCVLRVVGQKLNRRSVKHNASEVACQPHVAAKDGLP